MNDLHDDSLSRLYRAAATAEPPLALDDRILAAARQAVNVAPPQRRSPWLSWLAPLGLAATVVLSLSVVLVARKEQPDLLPAPMPATVPTTMPATVPATAPSPSAPAAEPMPAQARGPAQTEKPASRPMPVPVVPAATMRRDSQLEAPEVSAAPAPAVPPEVSAPVLAPAPAAQVLEGSAGNAGVAASRAAAPAAPAIKAESMRSGVGVRYPEGWIEEIRRLKREGHVEAAREQLAAFRRAYPSYVLPTDLTE